MTFSRVPRFPLDPVTGNAGTPAAQTSDNILYWA